MRGKEAFKGTQHRLLAEQYDNTQRQVFCWVQKNAIYRQVITWMHNVVSLKTFPLSISSNCGLLLTATTVLRVDNRRPRSLLHMIPLQTSILVPRSYTNYLWLLAGYVWDCYQPVGKPPRHAPANHYRE